MTRRVCLDVGIIVCVDKMELGEVTSLYERIGMTVSVGLGCVIESLLAKMHFGRRVIRLNGWG